MANDTRSRMLVTLSVEELEELIVRRVTAAVRDEVERLCEPRFLTTAQVAEMLDVCTATVMNLTKREQDPLPAVRQLGPQTIRFERDAVVAWMREGRSAPSDSQRRRLAARGERKRR